MSDTKAKHTAGPWSTYREPGFTTVEIRGGKPGNVVGICRTHERDATLIAAAPELLSALELVAGTDTLGNMTDGEVRMIDIVRAAIAKARGEK